MAKIAALQPKEKTKGANSNLDGIKQPTDELVIGMVGPIVAGVSKVSELLAQKLLDKFNYKATIIKASKIISDNVTKVSQPVPNGIEGNDRVKNLQRAGEELRRNFDNKYIIGKAIEEISLSRADIGYEDEELRIPVSIRRATIIDSLKHPEEARLLKETYGGMYWQFSVFAPETVRERRLKKLGMDRRELVGIFTRDEDDKDSDYGQKVADTAQLSDFFLRNDGDNTDSIEEALDRFLDILFGISIHTPNIAEAGMFSAVSAANKSACLSRQVGAAIYSSNNELLSVGWNDVPKMDGGLYSDDDRKSDHRCFKWMEGKCHNDDHKEKLYQEIFEKINGLLKEGTNQGQLRGLLRKTKLKQIIEYSRSIHAEMEAIISVARSGKSGLRGAKLYTTTFPCHNCARHIVASGISEVYYIEPYAKSLALDLHDDSISLEKSDGKIPFLQYQGVSPSVAMKLFAAHSDRKEGGKLKAVDRKVAVPVLPPPLDGFTTHEKRVTTRINEMEKSAFQTQEG